MASRKLAFALLAVQSIFIILFGTFATYETSTSQGDLGTYPYFQDVHIMIFVGFGFLMTFLKRYGYGAVSFNLMLAAIAIQWAMIVERLIEYQGRFPITFTNLIQADVASAAVLISFGAVLGRVSPLQLLVMTLVEIVLYAINFFIGVHLLKALDAGGSIFVHTFGAYFGLGVARACHRDYHVDHKYGESVYHSDLFSMIGTIFLWICWPSFNAGLMSDPGDQYRAIVNTYLSLVACTIVTFAISSIVDSESRLDIVHIQNATLAGGVAIGACANFIVFPFGAMCIGALAGAVSVLGYRFLSPCLANTIQVFDSCGVHNLHGMPGVLSGILSAVCIVLADPAVYGPDYGVVFPMFAHNNNGHTTNNTNNTMMFHANVVADWQHVQQGGMQLAALGITLLIALAGGLLTGLLMTAPAGLCERPDIDECYNDESLWMTPDDLPGNVVVSTEQQHELNNTTGFRLPPLTEHRPGPYHDQQQQRNTGTNTMQMSTLNAQVHAASRH